MRHSPTGRLGAVAAVAVTVASVVVASAAPANAQDDTYGDVPDDAFYAEPVAELASEGVFDGTECANGFCPDEPIDRKTMAVWIVRVLDGRDPAADVRPGFDDVDGLSFHAPFIERMAEIGVTSGCGDGSRFCPDRSVTRAQMAAFLSRAYRLPDGPDPGFGDVASDAWYAADVARLVASGATAGCGDGTVYCPEQDTTRAQMAVFLHRADNRGGWQQIEGESADGPYVEFRASQDQTEVPWRPKGLALSVRCIYSDTEEPDLEVSAFGYGEHTWFWGGSGVIEYGLGDDIESTLIYADASDDNSALIVRDEDLERFFEAMAADTSGELSLGLFDRHQDQTLAIRIDGLLSVVGYHDHVKPLVEACT